MKFPSTERENGHLFSTWEQLREWQQKVNTKIDFRAKSYIFPTVICSALSGTAVLIFILRYNPGSGLALLNHPVVGGFAGAFVWGIFDFIDRFRTLNLSPSALHMTWFRLLLGPILGFYIQMVVKDNFAPFIAFGLGTLPVPEVAKWIRDKTRSSLSIAGSGWAAPGWPMLEGMTEDTIPRLIEADVSSTWELANQDPINLLQRTSLEWRSVLDLMDQAYLLQYVGEHLQQLRKRGVRGAIEMAMIHKRLLENDTHAELLVSGIATDLGTDDASVRNLVRNLYEDSQVDLIWALWFEPA